MSRNALGEVTGLGILSGVGAADALGQVANLGQGGAGGGGGVSLIFGSEWRTATGTSNDAFLDTSNPLIPWNDFTGGNGGTPSAAEIIATDGSLDDYGNMFRVRNAGTNSRVVRRDDMYPESTDHWGRVYIRNVRTTGNNRHYISIGGGSDASGSLAIQFALGTPVTSGNIQPTFAGAYDDAGTLLTSPYARFFAGGVDNPTGFDYYTNDTWYLAEWAIRFVTATKFYIQGWISEVDQTTGRITNADKWVTADFKNANWDSDTTNLETFAASRPAWTFGGNVPTAARMRRYLLGNEGPASGPTDSGYMDLKSFALSTEGRLRDQTLGLG